MDQAGKKNSVKCVAIKKGTEMGITVIIIFS